MSTSPTLDELVRAAATLADSAVEPSAQSMSGLRIVEPRDGHESSASVVGAVSNDSRQCSDGTLYCAISGQLFDGHDFIASAVEQGASAALVERATPDLSVPQIVASNVREAMPWFAAASSGDPSAAIPVVAVTGTNGKTTTTHFLRDIASAAGVRTKVIGTLDGLHTTPEAPVLQSLLATAALNDELVAIEVSSHALDQHRTDATRFRIAVFTNLSQDHLDYHGDMETYFVAKAALFDGRAQAAVVNVDDSYGSRLASEIVAAGRHVVAVEPSKHTIRRLDDQGSLFDWRGEVVELPIPGRFNITNALLAAESAVLLGYEIEHVVAGLAAAQRVPGRMDRVSDLPASAPSVFVDYSHTPDSLERAIATATELTGGRVIVVFGCGGDRDREKRPLMGRASTAADLAVATSDNPRSEDPAAIIADILSGVPDEDRAALHVEVDRRAAISFALDAADQDDVVVVAGKGHETTQTFADRVEPFDDRQVVVDHYRGSAA